jgi:hypothetical protein
VRPFDGFVSTTRDFGTLYFLCLNYFAQLYHARR